MFHKNLKFYRLKKNLSKKELASLVNVTPMSITHYESGERKPGMDTMKALAEALDVRVTDFLHRRNENLIFAHGEFRKNSRLSKVQQEFIRESVEEYLGRFFTTVDILGGQVLPKTLPVHRLTLTSDAEKDALTMRRYLHIGDTGPVGNLIELLENRGILVYICKEECELFSGMNGTVNDRPYIIVNGNMSPERIRSTIAHELAHALFAWASGMEEREQETLATAIGGAFLFPAEDAVRELGIRRSRVAKDMIYVCREYGISMYLLVKRANICGIINDSAAQDFYVNAGKAGWRKNEPSRIHREEPMLFAQLVFRAVCENEISIQKGAELLQMPYEYVAEQCFSVEG